MKFAHYICKEEINMTNSEFMKILNDNSLELTVEELENIIEEELQKDESEMDPDLIEYCLYYINKADSSNGKDEKTETDTKKPKKHRFGGKAKKILIIAATAVLLLVAMGVAGIATDEKAKSNAFSFYEDHIRVHFDKPKEDENSVPGTEIAGKLKNYDITDLKLPAMLFSNDCVYNKITAEIIGEDGVKYLTSVNMGYRTNEISGRAAITKYCSKEIIAPIDFLNTTEKSRTEELSVNGLTVYVVEQNDFSSITYLDDLTQYMMYFETDFDSVVEIAKTITTAEAQ